MWSSLVLALRFGWEDTCAGWYFWKVDPVKPRGRVLGLLYLAAGISHVLWVGLILAITSGTAAGMRGPVDGEEFTLTAMTMLAVFFAGLLGCGALTLVAAWISKRHRIKSWVDSWGYKAAIRSEWPPRHFRTNRCRHLCWHAMAPVTVVYLILMFGIFFLFAELNTYPEVFGALLGTTLPIGAAFVYLVGIEKLDRLVSAQTPEECWPELGNRG